MTSRLGLPYPGPTDGPDGADVPYWLQALAEALDATASYAEGILSSRPTSTAGSPGIAGRFYYVIGDSTSANNGILWLDYGTGWQQVNSAGTIVDVLANRPAANAIPPGTKFFATDQVSEYVSDGTSWYRVTEAAGKVTICLGAAADPGCILLQGQVWPSTSGIYADLYAKLGGTNLPDFTGLIPVGFKTSDVDFGTLLATGGEKKHTLTAAELAAHHHTFVDTTGTAVNIPTTRSKSPIGDTNTGSDTGVHWASQTADAGGGLSHNNLQPFRVVNFQAKL